MRNPFTRSAFLPGAMFLYGALAGCAAPVGESSVDKEPLGEELSTARQPITGGEVAWSWEALRAVSVAGCTGTLVAKRIVITAAHCPVAAGQTVTFYAGSTTPRSDLTRTISTVTRPPCVTTTALNDCSGQFADVAIIRLTSDAPTEAVIATMAWHYPGNYASILKVGRGNHDGAANPTQLLKWIMDITYSSAGNVGHFLSENEDTDNGDSGGPAYYNDRILGVLYGSVFEWLYRNKYAMLPFRLDWILTTMSYSAPFTTYANTKKPFTSTYHIASWTNLTAQTCKYACDKTTNCRTYAFTPGSPSMCDLYSANSGSTVSSPGAVVGYRY